ncbi:MAG TPA: PGPGW domain-containing protein [Thermoanaerobaculia bacterium]|nr:PGPGW domain-containing protein [Thermoanaerobaculia bacterium]
MSLVPALLGLLVSLLIFVAGLIGAALFVVRLPAGYFAGDAPQRPLWDDRHPVLRWTGRILKNVLGLVTVAVGIVLAAPGVPGPGLLTIVIGLTLLDFPGKRRLERRLIELPAVRSTVDRIRHRYGRPPLVLDAEESSGKGHGGEGGDE